MFTQKKQTMLEDFIPVVSLCRIVEEYAREFKGLIRVEMPEIMDFGNCVLFSERRELPHPFFTNSSIATVNGKILYNSPEGVVAIDPQNGTATDLKFPLNFRMVALDDFTLATYYYGTVNVWDMRTNLRISTIDDAAPYRLGHLAALPHNQIAIYGDGFLYVWDLASGRMVFEAHLRHVKCVAGLPSGKLVVGANNLLYVYKHGKLVLKRRAHDRHVRQLLALPGNLLASGGKDAKIKVWDVESLTCVRVFPGVKWGTMDVLADGSLVTVSLDGHHIYVYRDGRMAIDLAYFGSPMFALKAMSGNRLASFHAYGDVCVWL
jgi:WD40 repeat protein